jgi:hypothetical protein
VNTEEEVDRMRRMNFGRLLQSLYGLKDPSERKRILQAQMGSKEGARAHAALNRILACEIPWDRLAGVIAEWSGDYDIRVAEGPRPDDAPREGREEQ